MRRDAAASPHDEPTLSEAAVETDPVARIEAMADLPSGQVVETRAGRRIEVREDDGDALLVTSPEGVVELSVRFTDAGPVLQFTSAELRLSATRTMSLACDKLDVRAKSGIALATEGDLTHRVGGDKTSEIGGKSSLEAHAVEVRARLGDVAITANDDVRIDGERVLLNS